MSSQGNDQLKEGMILSTIKRQKTTKKIQQAIAQLTMDDVPLTVSKIAKMTGMSQATVYRYRHLLGPDCIRGYEKAFFLEHLLGENPKRSLLDELLQD